MLANQADLKYLESLKFLRGLLLRLFSLSSSGVSALGGKTVIWPKFSSILWPKAPYRNRITFICVMLCLLIFKMLWYVIFSHFQCLIVASTFLTSSSYLHNIRFDCRWFDNLFFRNFLYRRISQVVLGCQTFKKFINKSRCLCKDNMNRVNGLQILSESW